MPLTEEEKKALLRLARSTIESHLSGGNDPDVPPHTPGLMSPSGAFVSLHMGKRLRGCIGTFSSDGPLYKTVMEMAVSSATKDPRFPAVGLDELRDITIEISVLTPLKEIKDPSEIEVGRHGIFIIKGMSGGVLLPQVATEYGWTREEFLDATCQKAGLPEGCWKKGAKILTFEAEIFKE